MRIAPQPSEFDYVVVGAGAGGGVVAGRLALAGHSVLVIEAGKSSRENRNSQVPLFHAHASEDPELSWRIFVRHYAKPSNPDSKAPDGRVFYPRGSAVGGSTAVNAMICIPPHPSDWENLARITKDPSWNNSAMRRYFQRIERCQYLRRPTNPERRDENPGQHGFDGWLPIGRPHRGEVLEQLDPALTRLIAAAFFAQYPALALTLKKVREGYDEVRKHLLPYVRQLVLARLDVETLLKDISRNVLQGLMRDSAPGPDDPHTIEHLTAALERIAVTLHRIGEHPQELPLQTLHLAADLGELQRVVSSLDGVLDPNDARVGEDRREGVFFLPQSVDERTGQRYATADFLGEVQQDVGDRLTIWQGVCVTRVLLNADGAGRRAVGVECLRGAQIVEASHHGLRQTPTDPPFTVLARREVVLCAGALNTPQLLLLSGIGSAAAIEKANVAAVDGAKIELHVDLPGVGLNLHDRYEISVLYQFPEPLALIKDCICEPADDQRLNEDPHWQRWRQQHRGIYATNGGVIALTRRSRPDLPDPDLFIIGLPGRFVGYELGYAKNLLADNGRSRWSWVILKGHSRNRKGVVQLASRSPLAMPDVCFNYFDPENPDDQEDLKDVQAGVRFVRDMMTSAGPATAVEDGKMAGKEGEALAQFIRDEAWGHHACGTCKIGADSDPRAVLAGDFRVRGTWNLRVVDASVFPDIPGFFMAMPVYMVAEKAADVIHAASLNSPAAPALSPPITNI